MAEERSFVHDEAMSKGLAPTERIRRNMQFLEAARGVKCTELDRLRLPEPITDPSDGSFATAWPFPQYFRTKELLIQARETSIWSVNETTGVPTQLKTYTFADPSVESLANAGFATGVTDPTGWDVNAGAWGTEWTYNAAADTITHVAGNTNYVVQVQGSQTVPIMSGKLYRIRVVVTARTVGNFVVVLGTAASSAISTVGTHTIELTANASGDVRIVPTSAFDGTISSLSVMEIAEVAIPSGGRSWHFAAFDKLFVLANESAFIFYGPRWNWRPVVATATSITTVCNHGDRMVLAGFDATDAHYQTDFWDEIWNEWVQVATDQIVSHVDLKIGENVAFWSKGGGSTTDWPFTLEMVLFGLMDASFQAEAKIYLKDQIKKGEAGFMLHRFKGGIKRVVSMGDRIYLYGERGVTLAMPRQDMGYDMVPLLDIGVADRSTVHGSVSLHRMVAEDGQLWLFRPDQIQTEDYRHLLAPLLADGQTEVLLNHDDYNGDTYIANATKGFLRSQSGMSEIVVLPTSLITSANGILGATLDLSIATPALSKILVRTTEFDMSVPSAVKVLRHQIFSIQDVSNTAVRILYKNNMDVDFDSTVALELNDDGWLVPNQGGQSFKIELEADVDEDFKLDQIESRWILVGKHQIRGQFGAV